MPPFIPSSRHYALNPTALTRCVYPGDGAGVGKGRQIAGVVIDSYVRGRRNAVWVSISSDLHLDATRDFRDLGCHINIINNCQALDRERRTLGLAKEYRVRWIGGGVREGKRRETHARVGKGVLGGLD
eukprot:334431-Chlamydomonas_euryale.AAC.1